MNISGLNKKLVGKKAFITGAASGLGASFSRLLAQNEWELHLSDIDEQGLASFASSLPKKSKVYTYQLDVANKNEYLRVSERVQKNTDQLNLIINNAGIGDGELIQQYDPIAWHQMIQINLMGTYYGIHFLLPMLPEKAGMIINIGSAAGFMNAPGMSAYNASKAAVYALSETLYHELKPLGIHVSVATPTFFKTNIMSKATGSSQFVKFAEKQMHYSSTNAEQMAKVILNQASRRKFQIIYPKEARRNYFIKKWFPKLVEKQFEKLIAKFRK